jgi:hypothetical protein
MGGVMKPGLLVLVVLGLAAAGGCGSGGSSTAADTGKPRPYPWLKGPSREFLVPGGDNVVQTFGEEASTRERQRAFRVIAAWMKARAAQNWKKDCSYFSRAYKHGLVATDAVQVTNGKVTTCPAALAYFGHLASGSYKNNLTGPIDSLRVGENLESVEGRQVIGAYAQYHGNDGRDWVIPMEREGGEWKIAKAAPIDRMH